MSDVFQRLLSASSFQTTAESPASVLLDIVQDISTEDGTSTTHATYHALSFLSITCA